MTRDFPVVPNNNLAISKKGGNHTTFFMALTGLMEEVIKVITPP